MRAHARTSVTARLTRQPLQPHALPGVSGARLDGALLTCAVDPHRLSDLMGSLAAYGIESLTVSPPSLEDLFLRHYDGPNGSNGAGGSGGSAGSPHAGLDAGAPA